MAKHILVVDDDALLRRSLAFNLEQAGYRVDTAATAEDALRQFKNEFAVPVIFLTARRRELDEVVGLELGADDYVTKPFDVDILLAHIKAVLRRSISPPPLPEMDSPRVVGDLVVDPLAHLVTVQGRPIELTRREFDLLHALALEPSTSSPSKTCWHACGGRNSPANPRWSTCTSAGCGKRSKSTRSIRNAS